MPLGRLIKKTIVAIGGGEIGRSGYSVETAEIDREIISLAGKKSPKLLFFPTASGDSEGYFSDIKKHFGDELGCAVDAVFLIKGRPTFQEVKQKINDSDIIYIGGGNTLRMMKVWRRLGVDNLLVQAYESGKVMAGVSAGAICWFNYGVSDSLKANNPNAPFIKVKGLGLINALICPHFNKETDRMKSLKKMMRGTNGVGIALDNCCGLELIDNQFRIIFSKAGANAYRAFWKKDEYHLQAVDKKISFQEINRLISREK